MNPYEAPQEPETSAPEPRPQPRGLAAGILFLCATLGVLIGLSIFIMNFFAGLEQERKQVEVEKQMQQLLKSPRLNPPSTTMP